jgi:hypothetical protein
MSRKNSREARRKELHYPVWIELGDPPRLHNCMLGDVSEGGAKITLQTHVQLPKNFYLLLSLSGTSRRYCEVVWRKELSVGIKFIKSELQSEVPVEKPETVAL